MHRLPAAAHKKAPGRATCMTTAPLRPMPRAGCAAMQSCPLPGRREGLGLAVDAARQAGLDRAVRVSLASVLTNVVLALIKGLGGLAAGSTALLADAANSASDILVSLMVLGGTRVARRPPDADHPYGHGKAETVAAKIVALFVMGVGFLTGWESYQALLDPRVATASGLVLAVPVLSVAAKEGLFRFMLRAGRDLGSVALEADAYNQRIDAFSSLAALVGVAGARLGYPVLDPAMGLLVSGLVLRMGGGLYWRAIRELMDTAPDPALLAAIEAAVLGVDGVLRVDSVRARQYGPGLHVDLRIGVHRHLTVEAGHRIARRAGRAVRERVRGAAVFVHVNPGDLPAGEEMD